MAVTRRSALKRIGMLLGVGSAAAAGIRLSRGSSGQTFTLEGRGWHIYSQNMARGRLPEGGERMLSYGELYGGEGGEKVGDFAATYFGLPRPAVDGRLASLEQHIFTLPGGSLFGSGMTAPGFATVDEFAIVGGTGRYAGARGTYIVRQSHLEFGGDGTATITFSLMGEAVS